jgi:hypothetical protein
MIVLTELSPRQVPPDCISEGEGVWRYSFGGDETYVDDDGNEFFWGGRKQMITIRGVVLGSKNYTEFTSIANVTANEESFYWDDAAKTLYVHHADNVNDYAVDREIYRILVVEAGYATGRFPGQISYYPDLYFDPRITDLGRLSKRVDPLKFGLLAFDQSSYRLGNADGLLDDVTDAEALNSQVRFVLMQEGQTDINNGVRLFTGYTGGVDRSDEGQSVTLQEARTFYDREVCPSTFNTTDYPNIADQYVGERIPVAYGEIRRGIAVPIDTASFDKATGGTVTFKLADDSLYAIRAVDALYDNNGNEVSTGTVNLSACTVQYSVPADADVDLAAFSWRGEGYDIAGTFDNGLDIMKAAFGDQAELAYSADTFVTSEWDAAAAANTQSIGISVQSSGGIISELIEPVTVSLQGIVDVLGDGRITFRARDPERAVSRSIYKDEMLEEPGIEIKTDEVVSTIVVSYGRGWATGASSLRTVYSAEASGVTGRYGIDTTKPLGVVDTALATESDAIAVAQEIATTSLDPQTLVSVTIPLAVDVIRLLDVVQIDIGRVGVEDWVVGEVLERSLGLANGELAVELLIRVLPDRQPIDFALRFTEAWDLRITEDGEERRTDL